MLESFADPSIQVLFKQYKRKAICKEREKDYEFLSEFSFLFLSFLLEKLFPYFHTINPRLKFFSRNLVMFIFI